MEFIESKLESLSTNELEDVVCNNCDVWDIIYQAEGSLDDDVFRTMLKDILMGAMSEDDLKETLEMN